MANARKCQKTLIEKINAKGFTLIEMMTSVAIVGLLSAVAIPGYKQYQAKSKSGEATLQLAALYSAEQILMSQFNTYAACITQIDLPPLLAGYYITGFRNSVNFGKAAIGNHCPNAISALNTATQNRDNALTTRQDAYDTAYNDPSNYYWYDDGGGGGGYQVDNRASAANSAWSNNTPLVTSTEAALVDATPGKDLPTSGPVAWSYAPDDREINSYVVPDKIIIKGPGNFKDKVIAALSNSVLLYPENDLASAGFTAVSVGSISTSQNLSIFTIDESKTIINIERGY